MVKKSMLLSQLWTTLTKDLLQHINIEIKTAAARYLFFPGILKTGFFLFRQIARVKKSSLFFRLSNNILVSNDKNFEAANQCHFTCDITCDFFVMFGFLGDFLGDFVLDFAFRLTFLSFLALVRKVMHSMSRISCT